MKRPEQERRRLRTPEELVEQVLKRGRMTKRRHQVIRGAIAALTIVVIAIPATAIVRHVNGTGASELVGPAGSSRPTEPATPSPAPATASPLTSNSAPAAKATIVPAATAQLTPPPNCRAEDVRAVVTPSKATYGLGEEVQVSVALTNISDHDCVPLDSRTSLWGPAGKPPFCSYGLNFDAVPGKRWKAGMTETSTATWSQKDCSSGEQVPPGRYVMVQEWRAGSLRGTTPPAEFDVAG